MIVMSETDFVGHALCDYLRAFLPAVDIDIIRTDLVCGEPVGAIQWALASAIDENVPLPPVYVDHIRLIDAAHHSADFENLLVRLPEWTLVA